jgi:hypothetical protein
MSGREEIESEILRIKASLDDAVASLSAVENEVQAMADQEAGSGHYGIASSYATAKTELEQATATVVDAGSRLESVQATIAATAGLAAPPTPGGGVASPSRDPVAAEAAARRAIGRYVGEQKTVGQLLRPDGSPIGGEIWSGKKGPGAGGPGLVFRWNHMWTMLVHVEGHAAAVMRRDNIREATLIISRRPCDDDPYGCEWTLADCLPEGTKLRVVTVDADGSEIYEADFVGTGRGCANGD